MNGRYGDVERRVIDYFVHHSEARRIHLPGDFDLLLSRLLEAELLVWDSNSDGNVALSVPQENDIAEAADQQRGDEGYEHDAVIGLHLVMRRAYALTSQGVEYVTAIREARSPI